MEIAMDTYNKNRITRLRDRAVTPAIHYESFYLYFYRDFSQSPDSIPFEERYGKAMSYAFAHVPLCLDEDELIVGKAALPLTDPEKKEWESLQDTVQKWGVFCGQDSHMAVDYELLLSEGLEGIKTQIRSLLAAASDPEKEAFYRACLVCLDAVIQYSDRYGALAEELARATADPVRQGELYALSHICRRVPKYPASSFYEAVQSVHFITHCLSFDPLRINQQQFQLGHPDRYLLPFYETDISQGKLTLDFAQVLLDCLGIQINQRVSNGLSSGYMVGGRQKDGSVVCNDLTEMGLRVIEDIRLVYPSVGLCYTKDMPDRIVDLSLQILAQGCSHPAFFNEDVIQAGLKSYGVSPEDACEYIHSTCVEITPVGTSNVWVASPYTNMAQLLLDALQKEPDSFEQLLSSYLELLKESIRHNFEAENENRKIHFKKSFHPLLSCFVGDCLARGLDIEKGGARYNWIMPSFVGVANAVDSLYAVKEAVFEKKLFTIPQLLQMLSVNFEGYESARLMLLNHIPKYGNNMDDVDQYFCTLIDFIVQECKNYTPILPNARLIPSVFCWVMHEAFGRETGATPDGRKAGFPLGDGSGPCQGREANGPTSSILSSTKWSHKELIGGVAVNMKFSKKIFTEESCQKVKGLIRVYMERGGFELQINVTDRETLLKARENPEAYQDLVVRIGGYSDYFVKLSPNMQDEVLLRTEHEI